MRYTLCTILSLIYVRYLVSIPSCMCALYIVLYNHQQRTNNPDAKPGKRRKKQ
nr:MAG TPA: hypothetical protein [Caudoviricetes sp.]DAP83552.1 MAG TPA: hypothetical protein [Caudoviricetes sp.]